MRKQTRREFLLTKAGKGIGITIGASEVRTDDTIDSVVNRAGEALYLGSRILAR